MLLGLTERGVNHINVLHLNRPLLVEHRLREQNRRLKDLRYAEMENSLPNWSKEKETIKPALLGCRPTPMPDLSHLAFVLFFSFPCSSAFSKTVTISSTCASTLALLSGRFTPSGKNRKPLYT
jgi:hypothetical protein